MYFLYNYCSKDKQQRLAGVYNSEQEAETDIKIFGAKMYEHYFDYCYIAKYDNNFLLGQGPAQRSLYQWNTTNKQYDFLKKSDKLK